tara:strand:- start:2 stop:202 length:201 start_codon:yes stop_codon:yes gene_type:complete
MSKIFELLLKYLGIPLAEKLGKWLFSMFKEWQSKRKIIKDQKIKTKAINEAKTVEEIKAAHRNNRL